MASSKYNSGKMLDGLCGNYSSELSLSHTHTHTHSSRTRLDALVSMNKILSYKMVAHHLLGRSVSLHVASYNQRRYEMITCSDENAVSSLYIVNFDGDF